MCCCDWRNRLFVSCLLLAAAGASAEHVVSIGVEADNQDSKAFALLGSVATGEKSWLTASALRSSSEGTLFSLDTLFADVGFDHHFDPVGVRVGIGYWGDSDLLDSVDARAALYVRNDRGSLSIDYERRAFDLTIRSLLLDEVRRTEFDGNGIGLSARLSLGDSLSVYANGMSYDYSRDISLQENVVLLRIFSQSRLSMINSLLDQRISGGIEWSIGTRMIDLRAATWETAVFGDRVESVGVGLLTPLGSASDIEFRISTDESDASGRATVFSVFLYFYGQ